MPGGTDESPDWCKRCELRWRSRHMLEARVSSSHILSWHFAWTPALQTISSHCNLMTKGRKRMWCQSHEPLNGDVVIMNQWDTCSRNADICRTMVRSFWPLSLQSDQSFFSEQIWGTKLFIIQCHKSFVYLVKRPPCQAWWLARYHLWCCAYAADTSQTAFWDQVNFSSHYQRDGIQEFDLNTLMLGRGALRGLIVHPLVHRIRPYLVPYRQGLEDVLHANSGASGPCSCACICQIALVVKLKLCTSRLIGLSGDNMDIWKGAQGT